MNLDEVEEISGKGFDSAVKNGTVLVDFFAEWCMPCLMMEPIMEELNDKFQGKVKFVKINIDNERAISQKFNIRSIPNFVLFQDGEVVQQFVGAMNSEEFEEKLRKFV
ncbi:MAG TPA: thioredoxin [Candidatus Nanoarchaeia archaeon]|nr:thioredoxin [Candidatus Nanoarchaeia archaeon]